jgi:uncharacterized membrane protein YcaP (DUF421 family)
MDPSKKIVPFDIWRMAFGELPPAFAIEVALRVVVLFLTLIFSMRLMGRRLASGLGRNELFATVALAGAVGPAVQDPDRGLIPAIVVAALVVSAQRLLAKASRRSRRVRGLLEGHIATLVTDARMDLRVAKKHGISRDVLLAQVRVCGEAQLGRVERLYLEQDGSFTFIPHPEERAGLTAIPAWDDDMLREQQKSQNKACANCGALERGSLRACSHCGAANFTDAVK